MLFRSGRGSEMMNSAVAKRYGQALLQIGQEHNAVDSFKDDFKSVVDTIQNNSELSTVWNSQEIDRETKIKVVKELFNGKVAPQVINLLCVVAEKGREEFIGDIYEMYVVFADEAKNVAFADVVSAYPLTAEQEETIASQLAKKTGKDVKLTVTVDSSLVGGIVVKFGDEVFDGSVAARLQGKIGRAHV